jgi:hypothetical protein
MESRNIWNAASNSVREVCWIGIDGPTQWQYIGEGDSFDVERVQKLIDEHLPGKTIYLVNGRHESAAIQKSLAAEEVIRVMKDRNIWLCDSSFKAFIEFSCIGVLRCGKRNS